MYYLCIRKGGKASKGEIPGARGTQEQDPPGDGAAAPSGGGSVRCSAGSRELPRERGSGKGRVKTRCELRMDFVLQSERDLLPRGLSE